MAKKSGPSKGAGSSKKRKPRKTSALPPSPRDFRCDIKRSTDGSVKKVVLNLPLPPSQNKAYTNYGKKGRGPKKETRDYWEFISGLISGKIKEPLQSVKLVKYVFTWPNHIVRDTDNFLKVLKDGLKCTFKGDDMVRKGIFIDDNWKVLPMEVLISNPEPSKERAGVVITIYV